MDFRTPNRSRYHSPRPERHAPVATVPPPPVLKPELVAESQSPRKKRLRRPSSDQGISWKKIIAGLIVLGLIVWLARGYITTKNQLEQQKTSDFSQTPTQQLVNKVSKKVELPAETPVIYTVNDAQKLKNQAFFVDSKDGDKVLYFPGSKVAVLYRPSSDKIIRYQPVSLEGASNGTSATP